jgi:hypothetical protein
MTQNIVINGAASPLLGGTITASAILSPFGNPSAWDTITIGGLTWGSPTGPAGPSTGATIVGLDGIVTVATPASLQSLAQPPVAPSPTPNGYVVIEGAERRFSWDPKHGKAQEGWLPTYQGTKGKQFKLRFRMWTDSQFQYWLQYRKMFDYLLLKLNAGATVVGSQSTAAGNQVNALAVSNPKLAMVGIKAIYCEVIHEMKPFGDKGEYEVQVDVWEFRPPPPRNTVSTPSGTGPPSRTAKGFQYYRTPTQVQVAQQTVIAEQHAGIDNGVAAWAAPILPDSWSGPL